MLVIYNAKLIDKEINSTGYIVCKNQKIIEVGFNNGQKPEKFSTEKAKTNFLQAEYFDAKGLTLMPAFIDMHAHFRYPGQPQKEDLDSGLKAAKNGGFGTLVLMPNTNPVISSYEQAMAVINEAKAKKMSNIFQTVSITKNFEGKETLHLDELNKNEIPVITEDGHDVLNANIMLEGMKKATEKGIIVSCHSEDPTLANEAREYRQKALSIMKEYKIPAWGIIPENLNVPQEKYDEIAMNFAKANDLLRVAEDVCTYRNIELANLANCSVHIAHVSTKGAIDCVRMAKKKGYKCTCEITPHHLALTGTKVPEIFALVNPPLRSEEDRKALIEALKDGTADTIATDHAPHTSDDKTSGAPGFTGSETAFAVCNTVLVKQEGFSLNDLSRLMSWGAAKVLGLQKGLLKTEYDADFVLVDPEEKWVVKAQEFYSKGKASPFEGKTLVGKVKKLFVGGKEI